MEARTTNRTAFWLNFVLHQFLGVWGILFAAPSATLLFFVVLHLLGKEYPRPYFYWILSGRPYFPVQIGLAVFLGWVFSRHLWHRSMVWVWILPLVHLCYAFVAIPTLTPNLPPKFQAGIGESRLSHYFGWGCGPWNHCLDQTAVTLPFYVAAAYSIGALLAHKSPEGTSSIEKTEDAICFAFGVWLFVAAVRDFYISARAEWHWMTLPLGLVPAGIGVCVMLLAFLPVRGRPQGQ